MLVDLPEDVLLDVIHYLEVRDVLTLRKTCRTLHTFGGNDYVWHKLIAAFPLPIDVPFNTRPTTLPGDELQRCAIKAIRLDANWRRLKTRVRGMRALLNDKSGQYVDQMQFLPGGKWLWTAQRTLKREVSYTRMSLWSLDGVENPRCVWSTEVSGIYRSCTVVQSGEDDFATLVVGVCDQREVIEMHSISLQHSASNLQYGFYPNYPIYPPPAPVKSKQLHVVPHPRAPHLRPIIHEIATYGSMLIVTIFALDTGGGAGSLQILFVNPETGATKWVDPSFAQAFSFLWVRVWGDYLFLVGQVSEDFVVRVYAMPRPFVGTSPSTWAPPGSPPAVPVPDDSDEDDYTYSDLGPVLAQFAGPTPMAVPRHHIPQVSPATTAASLSAIMFYHSSNPHSAQLLRFAFDISSGTVTLDNMSSKDLPIGNESSPQLAQVGALGFRAVWLEHNWETQLNRVMKLAYDPVTGTVKVGMLLPPDPELPFSPNMCHSLAFDEVTGRLCLGMYDGNVYLLDFV
ncbi:hypothetical protein LXA43DRAFT_984704 [Ganoderma leucocontextum]|nr:hypothetical protein LXA43DRAFT_984704 [Ganoderma leucocontextum]